jgi:hypothetical protein
MGRAHLDACRLVSLPYLIARPLVQVQHREYLDEFVVNIDSSQTLARLLSQSTHQRTSDAAAARYKRNNADHHIPGR